MHLNPRYNRRVIPHPLSATLPSSLSRHQYLRSPINSWFRKMTTLETNLQFCFVEEISGFLVQQSVTAQLNTGMEEGTGHGAEEEGR